MHEHKQDHPSSVSGVASADRALAVLTAFKRGDTALGLSELSKRTGLVKSTIMRLVISLERFGLLKRLPDGTYRLDAEVMRLGSIFRESLDLESHVMPVLRRLASETEESASFYVRNGDFRVCLYRVDSPHPLRLHIQPGDMLPMDTSSVAQVLRRFGSKEAQEENSPDVPIYTSGVRDPHSATLSAPVFEADTQLAGALVLSGPITRLTKARAELVGPGLCAGAAEITRGLGGSIPDGIKARATTVVAE
jgi:DNA-binding IclR family transcriptional regulator